MRQGDALAKLGVRTYPLCNRPKRYLIIFASVFILSNPDLAMSFGLLWSL
jgi:hypothetical protein